MGARFSALRAHPTSLLPTSSSNPSSPSSHSPPTAPSSFSFSPSLHALLGPTIPLSSPYWSTSLLDLCLSLSHLSSVASSNVHAVLLRSCHLMHQATVVHHYRNLPHLMLVLSHHVQRMVEQPSLYRSSSQPADAAALTMDGVINLLFLCRTFLHYLIQHASLDHLHAAFAVPAEPFHPAPSAAPPAPATTASAEFLLALYRLSVELPVSALTYDLHVEALSTLETLWSSQLYHTGAPLHPSLHPFLAPAFAAPTLTSLAPSLVQALLSHAIEEITRHFELPNTAPSPSATAPQRTSLLGRLTLSLSSILLLPLHIFRYFFPPPTIPYPLADRSLVCFLLLAHQSRVGGNAYRDGIAAMEDKDDESGGSDLSFPLRVSYDEVYAALLYTLPSSSSVLLLFTLLHQCPSFLAYVYAKTEIELLILPLLQSLYAHIKSLDSSASSRPLASPPAKHVYLLLILLLILSSDASFVQQSHRALLSKVPWHHDYPLSSISLASFISLLLLRLLHHHLAVAEQRDAYVVSNALAILSNLAQHSYHLHPAVIRRMVNVLEVVSKRYKRLKRMERMRKLSKTAAATADAAEPAEAREVEDGLELLGITRQYLSILCMCAHPDHLHENVQLVYSLMNEARRHVVLLSSETRLGIDRRVTFLLGLIAHFELVVDVYYRQQQSSASAIHLIAPPPPSAPPLPPQALPPLLQQTAGNADIDPVLKVIAADAQHWRHTIADSSLGSCVERVEGFRYVEEDGSDDFTIPMVWDTAIASGAWSEWGSEGPQHSADEDDEDGREEATALLKHSHALPSNGHTPDQAV